MAINELVNSRRRFRKATFTPIRLGTTATAADADVLAQGAVVRNLDVLPAEFVQLRATSASDGERAAIDAVAKINEGTSADQNFRAVRDLAAVPADQLTTVVKKVQVFRADAFKRALNQMKAPAGGPTGDGPVVRESRGSLPRSFTVPGEAFLQSGSAYERSLAVARRYGADLLEPVSRTEFYKAAKPYLPPGTDEATLDPIAALEEIDRRRRTSDVAIDRLLRRAFEPLGLLHLESLEMTPVDIERGELLYSLPLAPKEKVTLSHKEWAVRQTEFTEFVQDYLENYSERGVAETDEIALSSENETRRTDRTSIGPTNGVTVTPPAEAGGAGTSVVTNAQSIQESRRHARTVTSNASSRSVRDHKVSFTVVTTTGTEDFTSRLIVNEEKDKTMRVDYYRRMRRWQVKLYRVGVRLTYDVVIPDPGRRLRARHELLRRYDEVLTAQFDPKVRPSDINANTWDVYAASYNAVLTPPPAAPVESPGYKQWQLQSYATLRDAAHARFIQVQETIRHRRAELARQIDSAADGDALRQLEREQLMRSVLEWLFPGFVSGAGPDGDFGVADGLSDASWLQVMEYGEYIKFIHSSVDWNNLTYVLYPYFWNSPGVTDFGRLYLKHPDRLHQDFLRAGAVRIILPIRAGFESEVASLLDQGRMGKLPDGHRFQQIVQQVQKAQADLSELLDGEDDDDASGDARGVLIGSWTEYTPTAALDLDVTMAKVED